MTTSRLRQIRAHRGPSAGIALSVAATAAALIWLLSGDRVPAFDPLPAAVGLAGWMVGKFLLCPLRWYLISGANEGLRWFVRVYSAGEVFASITPARIGGAVWRMRALQREASRSRSAAIAELLIDRALASCGAIILVLAVTVLTDHPARNWAGALAVLLLCAWLGLARHRPWLFATVEWPAPPVTTVCLLLSTLHQLSVVGLLLGALAAVGQAPDLYAVLIALCVGHLASVIPSIGGFGAREGALVGALMAAGIEWEVATAAVALNAAMATTTTMSVGLACLAWRPCRVIAHRRYSQPEDDEPCVGRPGLAIDAALDPSPSPPMPQPA